MADEHQRFIEAILKYGNEWKNVQKYVRTRSSTQARSHAQKFFVKIKKTDLLDNTCNSNSIKGLYEKVGEMKESEYKNTIKKLNKLAFDRKTSSTTSKRKELDNSPDITGLKKSEEKQGITSFTSSPPPKRISISNIEEFLNLNPDNESKDINRETSSPKKSNPDKELEIEKVDKTLEDRNQR